MRNKINFGKVFVDEHVKRREQLAAEKPTYLFEDLSDVESILKIFR